MCVKPSSKFKVLVESVHGSVNAAAEAWGVEPKVLYRFVQGKGGISLDTAARIAWCNSVALDDLFVVTAPDDWAELQKGPKR